MDFDDLERFEVELGTAPTESESEDADEAEIFKAVPCLYRLVQAVQVNYTILGVSKDIFVDQLEPNTLVNVLEIVRVEQKEKWLRARIEHPFGWITLTENGQVYAERLDDQYNRPGVFLIDKLANVTSTLTTRNNFNGCKDILELSPGCLVRVVEVELLKEELRIRGRIEHPVAGWISLFNAQNGYRWATRMGEDVEATLLSLEGISVGATLLVLQDADALAEACAALYNDVSTEVCESIAGSAVVVLELDAKAGNVKCRVPKVGDMWLPMHCFAYAPSDAEEPVATMDDMELAEEEKGAFRTGRRTVYQKWQKDAAQREAEEADDTDAAEATEVPAPSHGEADLYSLIKLGMPAAPMAASAAEASVSTDSKGIYADGPHEELSEEVASTKPEWDPCSLESYPLETWVEIKAVMVMRAGQSAASRELLRLEVGHECLVVAHSPEAGSRRLFVKEIISQTEGWISCATKAGRPLISPVTRRRSKHAETANGIPIPSMSEFLEQVDSESLQLQVYPGRHQDAAEPPDTRSEQEKAEEAAAVWRSFADMGCFDGAADEQRLRDEEATAAARASLMEKFGGLAAPQDAQVSQKENLRLRLMESRLAKRDARERLLAGRLQRALAREAPFSRSQAIRRGAAGGPAASAGTGGEGFGGASSSSSVPNPFIQELLTRLEEERGEEGESEPRAEEAHPRPEEARGKEGKIERHERDRETHTQPEEARSKEGKAGRCEGGREIHRWLRESRGKEGSIDRRAEDWYIEQRARDQEIQARLEEERGEEGRGEERAEEVRPELERARGGRAAGRRCARLQEVRARLEGRRGEEGRGEPHAEESRARLEGELGEEGKSEPRASCLKEARGKKGKNKQRAEDQEIHLRPDEASGFEDEVAGHMAGALWEVKLRPAPCAISLRSSTRDLPAAPRVCYAQQVEGERGHRLGCPEHQSGHPG